MRNPILVTGTNRSGTTWIGKMLAISRDAVYRGEPFAPWNEQYHLGTDFIDAQFKFFGPKIRNDYYNAIRHGLSFSFTQQDFQRHWSNASSLRNKLGCIKRYLIYNILSIQNRRAVIKDPLMFFNTEWVYQEFGATPVVVVRHPVAFIHSLNRMSWKPSVFQLLEDQSFKDELKQMGLMMDLKWQHDQWYLNAAEFWKLFHATILYWQKKYPDWIYIRHEDIAAAPIEGFQNIYMKLGLSWSATTSRTIERYSFASKSSQPLEGQIHQLRRNSFSLKDQWKQEADGEWIEQIYDITNSVSSRFYSDEDWL